MRVMRDRCRWRWCCEACGWSGCGLHGRGFRQGVADCNARAGNEAGCTAAEGERGRRGHCQRLKICEACGTRFASVGCRLDPAEQVRMSQTRTHPEVDGVIRWRWRVTGQVQGVGFRPAVYRWAIAQRLVGGVYNDAHGVVIEAQGSAARLETFEAELTLNLPRLARIASMVRASVQVKSDVAFVITGSRASACSDAAVTVDTSVCEACLAEMRDPEDRRYGHALINCTDCGPRFRSSKRCLTTVRIRR